MKEKSDHNDGDIMGRTLFEQNARGAKKFKFPLPDGTFIESEWVREEMIPKAGRLWPDSVRAALTARANAAAEETAARMRRAGLDTPDKRRAAGISPPKEGDIDSTGLPDRVVAGAVLINAQAPEQEIKRGGIILTDGPPVVKHVETPKYTPVDTLDPLEHAKEQLRLREKHIVELAETIEKLEFELASITKARDKWKMIVSTLEQ